MNIISKELVSEVLKVEVNKDVKFLDSDRMLYIQIDVNTIPFSDSTMMCKFADDKDYGSYHLVNIHELSHICKDKMFGSRFTYTHIKEDSCWIYRVYDNLKHKKYEFIELEDTKAIFKACQWILDNKGIK